MPIWVVNNAQIGIKKGGWLSKKANKYSKTSVFGLIDPQIREIIFTAWAVKVFYLFRKLFITLFQL